MKNFDGFGYPKLSFRVLEIKYQSNRNGLKGKFYPDFLHCLPNFAAPSRYALHFEKNTSNMAKKMKKILVKIDFKILIYGYILQMGTRIHY